MALMRMLGGAAGAVDRAVAMAMHASGTRDRAQARRMSHAQRIEALDGIARLYPSLDFFPEPVAIDPSLRAVRDGVFDAQWASTYTPFLDVVAEKYLARVANRTAHARLFLGERGRPAIIALHGYMGGQYAFEERAFPAAWFAKRGLDVALPIFPFHSIRGSGIPPFPSADPRMTIEGFRQAVADVGALVHWLRARGAPFVGVMGASLGGYTSALLATVSSIDFVMPMIPLASIADFALAEGKLGEGESALEQHAALDRAYRVVSPFSRPSVVPSSRVIVFAGENDRITPLPHARKLAQHLGGEFLTMPGGHLLQFGRRLGFRALASMLERERIISPRRSRT